ncbi:MAG: hypothetical protein NZ550_04635 [Fimbriimonadales bacterium]|nr:hypothetical protein [Fimbriimonadales bacterium]MDW8051635.1 hypothetical protein [Armatimonadota bacterium]
MKRIGIVLAVIGLLTQNAPAQTRELVLFPFGIGPAVQPTEEFNVGVELLNALYAQLKQIPNLYVVRFRETNPSILRALEENRLRRDRLVPPFNEREADGTWRAARIGAVMGANLAFAGRIEEFRYDPRTREVTLTVSGDLIDVASGEVLLSVAETGRGRLGSGEEDPNLARIAAVAQAAERIGAAIRARLVPAEPSPAASEPPKRVDQRNERAVFSLFMLILGALLADYSNR